MFIATNACDKGEIFFWAIAAWVGYVTCGLLEEQMRRPVSGAFAGLAAGAFAGAIGAFIRFHSLYGWF